MSADSGEEKTLEEALKQINDLFNTPGPKPDPNADSLVGLAESGKLAEMLGPDLMTLIIQVAHAQTHKFMIIDAEGNQAPGAQLANYCQDPDNAFLIIYPDASVTKVSLEHWEPETAEKWADEHNKWHEERGEDDGHNGANSAAS